MRVGKRERAALKVKAAVKLAVKARNARAGECRIYTSLRRAVPVLVEGEHIKACWTPSKARAIARQNKGKRTNQAEPLSGKHVYSRMEKPAFLERKRRKKPFDLS